METAFLSPGYWPGVFGLWVKGAWLHQTQQSRDNGVTTTGSMFCRELLVFYWVLREEGGKEGVGGGGGGEKGKSEGRGRGGRSEEGREGGEERKE